jgi:hypothetical protein
VGHTATLLDTGEVLVAGGAAEYGGQILSDAFKIDVDAGTTTAVPGGMTQARGWHRAVATGNTLGEVVLVGGGDDEGVLDSVEVYSRDSDSFSELPVGEARDSMLHPRIGHTATLLRDSNIYIHNGSTAAMSQADTLASVEVYMPDLNGLVDTGSNLPAVAREWHTATRLENGDVLLAGGLRVDGASQVTLSGAELFVPDDVLSTTHYDCDFVDVEDTLDVPRYWHTATLLKDGTVLLLGGLGEEGATARAEIFNPAP